MSMWDQRLGKVLWNTQVPKLSVLMSIFMSIFNNFRFSTLYFYEKREYYNKKLQGKTLKAANTKICQN